MLARRYADALLSLALEEKVHEQVREELESFSAVFEESGLRKTLVDPSLGLDDKKALLDSVGKKMKFTKIFDNFLKLLVEKKRVGELKLINHVFQSLYDESVGRLRAQVKLPVEADELQISAIKKGLKKSTGKEIVMDVTIDPSLIGGIVAQVGSVIYDGSLKTQLENIKKNIMRG